jgi:hypothetical protein
MFSAAETRHCVGTYGKSVVTGTFEAMVLHLSRNSIIVQYISTGKRNTKLLLSLPNQSTSTRLLTDFYWSNVEALQLLVIQMPMSTENSGACLTVNSQVETIT